MTEMNTNWRLLPRRHNILEKGLSWFENKKIVTAYNSIDRACHFYQPGGTCTIARDEMALRLVDSGVDTKSIGRWSWTRHRGCNNRIIRFVSVYVPHPSNKFGKKKVFHQQQRALLKLGSTKSVLSSFWEDFWEMVDNALEDNEQLVIMGDWNVDVRKEQFLAPFRHRNIIPATISQHGLSAPETFNRGNAPIDEILVSDSITVKASGYMPHGEGLGDHRPVWIDIDRYSILGNRLPKLVSSNARRLKTKDPKVRDKYNLILEEFFTKHGIRERTQELLASYSIPLSSHQITEYEKLDKLREQGMLIAERNCRKLKMGGVAWSPELQKLRTIILYLKASISRMKGTKVSARNLLKWSKKLKFSVEGKSVEEINQLLNTAFKKYKTIKKNHIKMRSDYLESLAESMEKDGKGKRAKILRGLIELEKKRAAFRRLKRIMKGDNNTSTTSVLVSAPDGSIREVINKEEMESAIINENRKKYHQTEDTCPFLQEPLRSQLGDCADGPDITKVIDGSFSPDPHRVDEYTRDFIKACKYENNKPKLLLKRSLEEYIAGWKKMDERTASRQLHFGHFKAACVHKENMFVHYALAEIPFRTGYSPSRWKEATNLMILKKAGVFNVEKLRTIVLYEADFNHNNKFLGKGMMSHTIDNSLLAPEQYSIPGRKSIDHALNRRLLFDIARYQKISMAMTSCDLKSCFDRIAHTPAILAALGYGIDGKPLVSMFSTIQDSKYVTRTAYGDSDQKFGGLEEGFSAKQQGVGQGNGAGPPMWAIVSSKMFDVMTDRGLATKIVTPLSSSQLDLCGFAFVDDSDIIAMAGNSNEPEEVMEKMQINIDCWEGLAKCTGGALEPTKSWWYLVYFQWDNGKWSYGHSNDIPSFNTLSAKDKDNNRIQLEYLAPNIAKEMLGVNLAPDGNNEKQVQILKEKAARLGHSISVSAASHSEAWLALQTMATKSIEYPLPALTLTEKECSSIMWRLVEKFLPKTGVNRNIKKEVRYGSISSQGLGVKNLYWTQGIHHVSDLVEHSWKSTITGHFIKCCLEALKMELGLTGNILNRDYEELKKALLTESWVTNTWQFMSQFNIKFERYPNDFPLLRQSDSSIMEHVYKFCPPSAWKSVNRCRIYLKALTVADITGADGKYISHQIFWGQRVVNSTRSHLNWPVWECPSKQDWRIWRRSLQQALCSNSSRKLRLALGHWIYDVSHRWKWFVDRSDSYLFLQSEEGVWKKYKRIGRSRLQRRFSSDAEVMNDGPTNVQLASIHFRNNFIFLDSKSDSYRGKVPLPSVVQPSISNSDNYKKWLFYSSTEENIIVLVQSIMEGSAIAVSDGSYSEIKKCATAAWTIESPDRRGIISGTSISPGPPSVQNSYRAEILGLLAILSKLSDLCSTFQIINGKCTIGCDGLEALNQATHGKPEWISPERKQSDFISACNTLIQKLPLSITRVHVKGHQDDHSKFSELSRMARMNVNMDFQAKQLLHQHSNSAEFFQFTPHPLSIPTVSIDNRPITHCLKTSLYEYISSKSLQQHWIHRNRFSSDSTDLIAWDTIKHAMQLSSLGRRRFVSKWCSNTLPTGKNMTRWNLRPNHNCPFCHSPLEDNSHITHCQHTKAKTIWKNSLLVFLRGLVKIDTCSDMLLVMKSELIAEHFNSEYPPLASYPPDLHNAVIQQRTIGWDQFMQGLISISWLEYQQQYYSNKQSRRKGQVWGYKLVKQIWDFTFAIWNGRNEQLHQQQKSLILSGQREVIAGIRIEFDIGIGRLPPTDFSPMFSESFDTIKKKSLETQSAWLAIVRNGRYRHSDPQLFHDIFSTNENFNKWLGLAYIIKNGQIYSTNYTS